MRIEECKIPDLRAEKLFENWNETLIWSCLQGIMGKVYMKQIGDERSAMAMLGDFCFFAGKADRELVLYKPKCCTQDFMIMIPENEQWNRMIETCYGDKAKKVSRYAIKKEKNIFDQEMLQKAVSDLPQEYVMKKMTNELFLECKKIPWCHDLVSQYADYECYLQHGLGMLVLKENEIVSGASSYAGYCNGIEIEIDTKKEYRRRRLAFSAGAGLILECMKKDWYPSWDAQNKESVALAEKLGYQFDHEYTAYEIGGY